MKYGTDKELLLHRLKGVARTIVSFSHEALCEVYKSVGVRMWRMQNGMPFTTYSVFCWTFPLIGLIQVCDRMYMYCVFAHMLDKGE